MVFLASMALMAYANRTSAYDALMVKRRDWDLVRPLCSAGSSPKSSRFRAGLPTSAGRSRLSLLSLLVRLSSLLQLLLQPLIPPKLSLPGETDGVEGLLSTPLSPRLQVLPLPPRALRVAPEATPPSCCRGWARCPSHPLSALI